jgi:predicted metalloprotease with PDZ domain
MSQRLTLAAIAALALVSPATAQNSRPQPVSIADIVPEPVDVPYAPGAMTLEVDATDIERAIFNVKQSVPVEPGKRLTLLYPQWLPGKHGPRGALAELAGLKFSANGQPVAWERDPTQVYAFHLNIPEGATQLDASYQFLSPVRDSEGRIVVTPEMLNVQWEQVSLYPAGHFTRELDRCSRA